VIGRRKQVASVGPTGGPAGSSAAAARVGTPPGARTGAPVLDVDDVSTWFHTPRGVVRAVDGVSLSLRRGRTLGLVGESGCGKSVLSRTIMGLLPASGVERRGRVVYEGQRIDELDPAALRQLWGRQLAMVFQDPMTSLNPVMRIGRQITESLRFHLDMDKGEARETALTLLRSVGIPEPARRLRQYPHELSGGMRQRVVIAIALACGPHLLLADEPTTALDVTVQSQILDLLRDQQRERDMAMILVTHDLGVVAGHTDEVAVMYAGQIVEQAPTPTLFAAMRMPYTAALVRSIPRLDNARHSRLSVIAGRPVRPPLPAGAGPLPRGATAAGRGRAAGAPVPMLVPGGHRRRPRGAGAQPRRPRPPGRDGGDGRRDASRRGRRAGGLMAGSGTAHLRPADESLLRVEHLRVDFPAGGGRHVSAVADVSLDATPGETLGLVGESGCGKSTTARAVIQLPPPTGGRVVFDGHDLTSLRGARLRALRPGFQIVFQDPISSLNPRRTVGDIVAAPLVTWGRGSPAERAAIVDEALDAVGIDPAAARDKRPHEFSGGQCQRICIARTLVLDPKLVICDEPVSALDVSVQAQILNLLEDLKDRYGLTLLFITHDLAVVKNVSDRVAVMYLGKVCEVAPPEVLYETPAHPYTAALVQSIPVPDPAAGARSAPLAAGELPSPLDPPSGCRFRTRCPRAQERCAVEEPVMRAIHVAGGPSGPAAEGGAGGAEERFVACHFPLVGGEAPDGSAAPADAAPADA
jgi:peptide/nickel transport system ATP-binding protein